MRYVMLICGDEEAWEQAGNDDDRKAAATEYYAWFEKWGAAGKVADGGAELDSTKKAKTVRAGANGVVVTDGPFIEAKEVVGGVVFLQADSLDEAIEIAGTWPGLSFPGNSIEVRPTIEHDM